MARRIIRPPTIFAEVSAVESWAATLPSAFLLCREMGHNWRPWRAVWNGDQQAYDRILMCHRCKSKRSQVLSVGGHVVRSAYDHAEGYLAQGLGRVSGEGRDRLRLESVKRSVEETNRKEA